MPMDSCGRGQGIPVIVRRRRAERRTVWIVAARAVDWQFPLGGRWALHPFRY